MSIVDTDEMKMSKARNRFGPKRFTATDDATCVSA